MYSVFRLPLVFSIVSVLLIQSFAGVDAQEHSSKLLVSPDWLEKQIASNSKLRIIDMPMSKSNYEMGHIPGSVYLDWRTDIISAKQRGLYQLPSKEEMEKLMARIGVTADSTVVATDNLQNRSAVRLYYTLKYFGHNDVRILNGGTNAWIAAKKELSKDVPKIEPTKYVIKQLNNDYVAKLETVQNAIDDAGCKLLDGRPWVQYSGMVKGKAFHTGESHSRPGHVPTAENIPWIENLNEDGTFKTIEELKAIYEWRGIDTDSKVITYCNEGLHAAMPWFVIKELFGNPKVTVYDNSMVEWANRDEMPLKISDKAKKPKTK